MRRVCAWCHKAIRDGSPPTSHGICEACEVKLAIEVEAFKGARN